MDALLSSLLENPESIGFPILFVGLLVWVMKQNNEREDRYLNTIDELTGSLKQIERMERTIRQICETMERIN
ncbi:BhlA/UviB family holin-like peptide [uncultured Enterococcus sp.]|uniref:BhlA/UviB family holin-like peptide n=1 Tax=uncultured Enterococcus sp. TaxID=167972 RepID=UPI0025903BC6|nr:BhlA/UviB family holin-like peptide [uncultured Enterococcus sp.]